MLNNENKVNEKYIDLINEKDEEIKNLEIAFKKEKNMKKQYENNIKILNEKMKELTINNNGSFIISSEFNSLWNELVKQISFLFKNYFDYPNLFFNLIQELFYIIDNNINVKVDNIKEYFIEVLSPGTEKISKKDLNDVLKELLKQNLKQIFLEKENNENEFLSIIENYIKFFETNISNEKFKEIYKNFINITSNEKFYYLIIIIKTIFIYIKFNDTDLIIDLKDFSNRTIKLEKFQNKEIIILNNKNNKNDNINGIYILKPPVLKSGYKLSNNIFPIVLEIKGEKIKNLNEEIENFNNSKLNNRHNNSMKYEYKNKYQNNKKIALNLLNLKKNYMKYKLIFNSKMNSLSPKEKIFFDINNITISDRKIYQNYFFTQANKNKNKEYNKINKSFTKEKYRPQSYLKYKTKKIFSNDEPEFKCEVQKHKIQFINKQVLKDLINQGERTMKIKLIKKPFVLLKNISLEKDNLKNKKTENNSATETTITIEYRSNTFNNPNCNLIYSNVQKKNSNFKNCFFENITSRTKIKKKYTIAKSYNKNNSCISNNYQKDFKNDDKNLRNNQIKLFENIIKKNKRPDSLIKNRFQD